jgi:CrcB protein
VLVWLAISAGGALGAVARWSIGEAVVVSGAGSTFPWETLIANVIGCAAIGVLAPLVIRRSAWVAGFAVTGFLGGFTTYSAFAEETFALLDRGDVLGAGLAVTYVLVTITATSIAVMIGSRLIPAEGGRA